VTVGYSATTAIASDLDHDFRNGERGDGQQCASGEFLPVEFLANFGEALRVTSVRNRHGHPHDVLQRGAGAEEGFFEIFKRLPGLCFEVSGERGAGVVDEPDVAG
jgi:hypothetical protein